MKKLYYKNDLGMIKEVNYGRGFSWAVFFFGILVPLLDREYKIAVKMAILNFIAFLLCFAGIGLLLLPILHIFYCFEYAEWQTDNLLEEGYKRIK